MKNMMLGLILALFPLLGFSQQKANDKVVIQTPGLQCETCKNYVENRLSREYGVISVKADYRKHTVTLIYIKDRTNPENLKAAIANLGYDAGDVTAEPEAFKRLPRTCQQHENHKAD